MLIYLIDYYHQNLKFKYNIMLYYKLNLINLFY
jgi:hypothetical protein